jgi:7-carboxy-7-deazaguanine synthase
MKTLYPVSELYVTIQGEGRHTGTPVVLVRLHGCPVGCPWCDTKYTWGAVGRQPEQQVADLGSLGHGTTNFCLATPQEIATHARTLGPKLGWVLLTGGEPGRYNLSDLLQALGDDGWQVMMETSGTDGKFLDGDGPDWLCVSPKIGMPGGEVMQADVIAMADEIKWPVGRKEDVEKLDAFLTEYMIDDCDPAFVTLQPLSMSENATKLCVETALARGYRVSIQTHKVMGLP